MKHINMKLNNDGIGAAKIALAKDGIGLGKQEDGVGLGRCSTYLDGIGIA